MESLVKSVEKLELKLDSSPREVYLQFIDRVLAKALYKYEHKQTKNSQRISWGRLIVQAISTGGSLLRDFELEDLQRRLEKLEQKRD